ncbi:hypothetical protein ACLMNJ_04910 [Streptomyces seoulensis]
MTSPVLIVAAADDWPTDRVVVELESRGAEVFRMDTADFPRRLALTGLIDPARGWTGELACGLTIPATLVTNQPNDVRMGRPIVCKPVASPVLIEDGQLKSVYTRKLRSTDLTDLRGIDTTAHLFQAWVDKAYEVRLTVVASGCSPSRSTPAATPRTRTGAATTGRSPTR